MTTKENEMSEREQFEAKFPCPPKVYWRGGGHDYWTDSEFTDTDIIAYFEQNARWQAWQAAREQQAKELAECQARVVDLRIALKDAADDFDMHCHFKSGKRCKDILASTDTAAQTLREKHYEECAVMTGYNWPAAAMQIRAAKIKE